MKQVFKSFVTELAILAVLIAPLGAQQPAFNNDQYRGSFAHETLTVSTVSVALTSATYNPVVTDALPSSTRADYAMITVETDCIRFWDDTTAPTGSAGHLVCAGGTFYVWGFKNLRDLRMIRVTTDATLQISYFRFASNVS